MRVKARRTTHSPSSAQPRYRWAWVSLALVGVVAICAFTLSWTLSRVDAQSARLESLERVVRTTNQASASQTDPQPEVDPSSADAMTDTMQSTGPVRLARIVACEIDGAVVAITYDPAQLFTGEDAVRLAASRGDAVTGDSYVFDPSDDLFEGVAPAKATVTILSPSSGRTDFLPDTISALAGALSAPEGAQWRDQYFWLYFNQGYIESVVQYESPEDRSGPAA
jgi:hypothetical protein